MGMIGRVLGMGNAARQVGEAVGGVAEVFVGNRAERDAHDHAEFEAVLGQFGREFEQARAGRFEAFVNGLNRLPRPMMALGTLALFGYAMGDPAGFSLRMQGLALVPEPLWWLLGAIVSFYFGARELHHRRERRTIVPAPAPIAMPTAQGDRAGASTSPARAATRPLARPVAVEPPAPDARATQAGAPTMRAVPVATEARDPHYNAALEEWSGLRG